MRTVFYQLKGRHYKAWLLDKKCVAGRSKKQCIQLGRICSSFRNN